MQNSSQSRDSLISSQISWDRYAFTWSIDLIRVLYSVYSVFWKSRFVELRRLKSCAVFRLRWNCASYWIFYLLENAVLRGESTVVLSSPLTFQVSWNVVRAWASMELYWEVVLTFEAESRLARNILWELSLLVKFIPSFMGERLYSFKESGELLWPAVITTCARPSFTLAPWILLR